jgi:hypothetical protein
MIHKHLLYAADLFGILIGGEKCDADDVEKRDRGGRLSVRREKGEE